MELLAPGRDIDALKAAFDAGADAVYLGLKEFSARKRAKNFTFEELYQANRFKKAAGKKIYVTINTLIYEREIPELLETLAFLEEIAVDAVIIQDYGVYQIVKDLSISLPLHASTQMGTKNHLQAKFLEKLGFKRIVLERQISLSEIESIRQKTSAELEVFIHGAMCFSLSGQCFFSQQLSGRSGNRGECSQPCRWSFRDERGCSVHPFSMKDLEGVSLIPALLRAGVNSLKIEGRMKGVDYVHPVVSVYRKAIDMAKKGGLDAGAAASLKKELAASTLSRPGGTGFFEFPKLPASMIESDAAGTGLMIGKVSSTTKTSVFFQTIAHLCVGDTIRIDIPKTDKRYKLPVKALYHNNVKVRSVSPGGQTGLPCPYRNIPAGAHVYLVHRRGAYKGSGSMPDSKMSGLNYRTRAKQFFERYRACYENPEFPHPAVHSLTFSPEQETYEIERKTFVLVPPAVYETGIACYRALLKKDVRGVLISHPCEAELFAGKELAGSFFLYAANRAAIRFYQSLGITRFSLDPSVPGHKAILSSAAFWIRWSGLPLWITRVFMPPLSYSYLSKQKKRIQTCNEYGILYVEVKQRS